MIIDEFTSMKWSVFLKQKSDTSGALQDMLLGFKLKHNIIPKHMRCDNAGENLAFQHWCTSSNEDYAKINFELTSRYSPHQNGKVERAFATMFGRIRSCNNAAKFTHNMRNGLWAECARHCTMVDNILMKSTLNDTPHHAFCKSEPNYSDQLHPFGEIGAVAKRENIKAKLANRGEKLMFIGYSKCHAKGVFRMMNLKTKKCGRQETSCGQEKCMAMCLIKHINHTTIYHSATSHYR